MAKNDYQKLNPEDDDKENVNPVLNANVFSRLTIWWMNKIFITGNKRPLEEDDLFPLLEEDKSEVLTQKLQREWEKELDKRHRGKRPRFWKALMRVCPWYEYFTIIALVLTDMANRMTLPVLLGFLISYLMGIRQLDVSFKYILPTFICITSLGRNLAQHHYQNRSALLGMRFRAAATGLLYKKVSKNFFPNQNKVNLNKINKNLHSVASILENREDHIKVSFQSFHLQIFELLDFSHKLRS